MKNNTRLTLIVFYTMVVSACAQPDTKKRLITAEELANWPTFDKGKSTIEGNVLIVEETAGSDGYFMISPDLIENNFILRYKVKALSESTVLINLFSVTQKPNNTNFTLPPDTATPREVWQWRTEMPHYNLTFNNRSHGNRPFFFKNNSPYYRGFYQSLPENIMEIGRWYSVEIGKKNERLWFKLNNTTHFDIDDCTPLKSGRLLFRISGTNGDKTILAKAAYKDIVILYE